MANIQFCHDYTALSFPQKKMNEVVLKILKNDKVKNHASMNVILCSDYKIRKLNKQYRKKDKATDVLSFPLADEDGFLGEIYISLQRCLVQSRRYGFSYDQEVTRMLVHGTFHLLGYDHKNAFDREIMEALERIYSPV